MKILKDILFFVVDCWRLIMDNRYNPLRYIADPSIQAYFTLALFIMWSGYFGVVAAYYMDWLGYSIVTSIWVHLAVVIPIMVTNAVFRQAEESGAVWVKDYTNKKIKAHMNKLPKRREEGFPFQKKPLTGKGQFDKQRTKYTEGDNT